MSKFKVGDRVRQTDWGWNTHPEDNGKEAIVIEVADDEIKIKEIGNWFWRPDSPRNMRGFELVKSEWTPEVGDKVIVKSKSVPGQLDDYNYFIRNSPSVNGYWIVKEISGDGSGIDMDNCILVVNRIGGYSSCFAPQDLELYEERYSNKPISNDTLIPDGSCINRSLIWGQKEDKKPNKIKQIMNATNNIIEFAANLTLSSDEKLLREVGLKDSNGLWTSEAGTIAYDLEAVSLGCKNFEKLCTMYSQGNESISAVEAATLIKKYEDKLLEIAKAKKASESKK